MRLRRPLVNVHAVHQTGRRRVQVVPSVHGPDAVVVEERRADPQGVGLAQEHVHVGEHEHAIGTGIGGGPVLVVGRAGRPERVHERARRTGIG